MAKSKKNCLASIIVAICWSDDGNPKAGKCNNSSLEMYDSEDDDGVGEERERCPKIPLRRTT